MSSDTSYTSLASVYDRLNGVDYVKVADHIERQFEKFAAKKPESVLDLACGTGSLTVELAARGYDMTGVDISEEMLSEARFKCDANRFPHKVLLVRQDMAELELYGTVDAIVCCLDSLNYLTDTGRVSRALSHIHNYLNPEGLFVFDMNTPYKYENVYGQSSIVLEEEGVLCAWQNDYNPKSKMCDFYLSIFRELSDGLWERSDEVQRERCYSLRTVKKLLDENGFELLAMYGEDGGAVSETTERWLFTAKRKD